MAAAMIGVAMEVVLVSLRSSGREDAETSPPSCAAAEQRQRALDLRATAAAGVVTTFVAIAGAVVNIARTGGNPGPYGVICMVLGISYGVATAVLRWRS